MKYAVKRIVGPISMLGLFFAFAPSVSAQFADLVVVNANVGTIDDVRPKAEAIAVKEGRFIFVGSSAEAGKFIGPGTKTIDAGRKLVIPGFNDSHVHLMNVGLRFFSVDLRSAGDVEGTLEKIRLHARFLPKGEWILGSGWVAANAPTLDQLNEAAPDNPVLLYGRDARFSIANSRALEIAGITNASMPVGGALAAKLRAFAPSTPDRLAVLETAVNYAAAFGVTSVQDVSSDDLSGPLNELEKSGKLKTRVYDCVGIDKPLPKIERNSGSMVRGGCLKHYSEGDYSEMRDLTRRLAAADRAGVQILLHAIGPRANDIVLTVFERVVRQNGKRDRRLRVEHAHNFQPWDLKRFAPLPAIASMQPALFYFVDSREYFKTFADLRNAGVRLAFGSDAAMIEIDPLKGIAASTGPGGLTIGDAVRAYTLGAAYAEFQENDKGSITVGKLADFLILSGDIFAADRSELLGLKVEATFVGGRVVYQSGQSALSKRTSFRPRRTQNGFRL